MIAHFCYSITVRYRYRDDYINDQTQSGAGIVKLMVSFPDHHNCCWHTGIPGIPGIPGIHVYVCVKNQDATVITYRKERGIAALEQVSVYQCSLLTRSYS